MRNWRTMPGHSARSLFDQNIESANDCAALYDAIVKLRPANALEACGA
jgi:hypothetical protein